MVGCITAWGKFDMENIAKKPNFVLAFIKKNIVFVGVGRQIRIWAEEAWDERERTRNLEKMRETMARHGL